MKGLSPNVSADMLEILNLSDEEDSNLSNFYERERKERTKTGIGLIKLDSTSNLFFDAD